MYDILHGINIITGAFTKSGGPLSSKQADASPGDTPLGDTAPAPEFLIHLTNAGVVLPASSKCALLTPAALQLREQPVLDSGGAVKEAVRSRLLICEQLWLNTWRRSGIEAGRSLCGSWQGSRRLIFECGRSLKVLVADVDYVMLGMPGNTLSDSALTAAGLPSVKGMLRRSEKASRLFKPDGPCASAAECTFPAPRLDTRWSERRHTSSFPGFCAGPNPPPSAFGEGQAQTACVKRPPEKDRCASPAKAPRPRTTVPRSLKPELPSGRRGLSSTSGVIFLDRGRGPTLPQVRQQGVLNVAPEACGGEVRVALPLQ